MKQLNLFSERRSDTIRNFKNEIASYTDILSETSGKISYSEFINQHKDKEIIPGMEYEEYVDIYKKDLNGLDNLKKLLDSRNIHYETALWT